MCVCVVYPDVIADPTPPQSHTDATRMLGNVSKRLLTVSCTVILTFLSLCHSLPIHLRVLFVV